MDNYQGPGEIQFNGSTLAESKSVRVSVASNAKDVNTMAKGLAGRSKGPVKTTINIENAAPLAGLEDEFVELCQSSDYVDVVVTFAGKRYQWTGWVDSVDLDTNVDNPASANLVVMAGPARVL